MASPTEVAAMRRAIDLAARALGATYPNPVVGAVVLDAAGEVAGEGWHAGWGQAHAEVVALRAAGERARGGTAVVTLEPCAHTGRTGPCVEALADGGIRRVVYAVRDPNPVAAGGAARLRDRGIEVEGDVLATEATRANEAWLHALRRGRPFVTWKFAATLDGRVAAADGTSRWITGAEARADAHRLRAECDAVLVGAGTVLTDDPHLTVRDGAGTPAERQPLRIVADRRGRVPATARILDGAAPTLVTAAADPRSLLAELHGREIRHLLLEGGPTLAGAFVRDGLVDRVVAYLAPALFGSGPAALADAGISSIDEALRLVPTDVGRVGDDIRVVAYPAR